MMKRWGEAIRLEEPSADGQRRSWIMLMPEGEYHHPEYGDLMFSRAKLEKFKSNFDQRVRKIDVALDVDHKGAKSDSRATGWIERLELREGPDAGLWGLIAWTPYGAQLLGDREYRYFSPEFGKYTDEQTGETFHDVIIGGALTNRPFLKVMPSVALSEPSRKPWGSVKKSNLPRACFLIQGDASDKSSWKLPVYEASATGGRGKLNLNGVKAAWGAVHGARSGVPMVVPSAVRTKLRQWMARYFGEAAQAAEGEMADETVIRLMGASGKAKPKTLKAKPKAKDEDEELDDQEMADEEMDDTEVYDDGEDVEDEADVEDDAEDDADEEEDSPLPAKKRSKKMGGGAANFGGKKAKPFGKRDAKQMSESGETYRLREEVMTLQEQLERQQFALYETAVDRILMAWDEGRTLVFHETHSKTRDPRPGQRVSRQARVVISPLAKRKVREFLMGEGYQLSEPSRLQFLDVVQTCLSEGLVDLSVRGAAWDQESRRTLRSRSQGGDESERTLTEAAEAFAAQDKKVLGQLVGEEALKYYQLAERETGYRG